MSDVRIDQAFISDFITADFGLPIAHESIDFSPQDEAYAELRVLQNDITMLNLNHSNQTDGVFRVILRTPSGLGSIPIKTKIAEIADHYTLGKRLEYEGLTLTITAHSRQPGIVESGWYAILIDLTYRCFTKRHSH